MVYFYICLSKIEDFSSFLLYCLSTQYHSALDFVDRGGIQIFIKEERAQEQEKKEKKDPSNRGNCEEKETPEKHD